VGGVKTSELISAIALVVSLSAAFFTYRLSRRSFRVMAYRGAAERALQMDKVFIDYPLVRPYFSDAEPFDPDACEDAELRNRVPAVAEFVLDILEDCWDYEDCYGEPDRIAWKDWIYDVFETAPTCCAMYAESAAWWPKIGKLFEEFGIPPQVQRARPEQAQPALPQQAQPASNS
jgi:hypothetical protein